MVGSTKRRELLPQSDQDEPPNTSSQEITRNGNGALIGNGQVSSSANNGLGAAAFDDENSAPAELVEGYAALCRSRIYGLHRIC